MSPARRFSLRALLAGATVMLTASAAGAPALAASRPAGFRRGSLSEYCAARVEEPNGPTDKKGATKAARETLEAFIASAPTPEQAAAVARIAGLFDKRGLAAFGSPKARESLRAIDAYTFANCGFAQIDVTAQDLAYEGIPAAISSGTVALRLTDLASDQPHEIVVYKIAPGVDTTDLPALLALPPKKAAKVLEFRQYVRAEPDDFGVSIAPLEPGTYVGACFLPLGGKRGAQPNYTEGMYATFRVSA